MRVVYPGPKREFVIDGITLLRGEVGELTGEQLKRAEVYGVVRAADAPADAVTEPAPARPKRGE